MNDLERAIWIAHTHRDGVMRLKEPAPTPAEALEVIEEALRTCGFNWITGQNARDTLRIACKESA